ncbi:MAG: hypothetical protein Q9190_006604, partial [Brigantiaea leucoxantha]
MGRGQGQSAPRKLPRPLVDGSYVSLVSRVFILRLMSFSVAVGRWQKNKDLSWYAKNDDSKEATDAAAARMEEIRRIKEAEQDALSQALGYPVEPRLRDSQVAQPKEVEKALRETAEGDEEGGKGIGFGAYAGAGDKAGDNEEMMVGYAGDLGGLEGGNIKKSSEDTEVLVVIDERVAEDGAGVWTGVEGTGALVAIEEKVTEGAAGAQREMEGIDDTLISTKITETADIDQDLTRRADVDLTALEQGATNGMGLMQDIDIVRGASRLVPDLIDNEERPLL